MGNADRSARVFREDMGGQTVSGIVGELDHFFFGLELDDNTNGTKDLFSNDLHVGAYVGEYGRVDKVAFIAQSLTADDKARSLLLAGLDVGHHPVELRLRNLGAMLNPWGERVSSLLCQRLRNGGELLDHAVVDTFLDEYARTGCTDLAHVETGNVR